MPTSSTPTPLPVVYIWNSNTTHRGVNPALVCIAVLSGVVRDGSDVLMSGLTRPGQVVDGGADLSRAR